MIDLGPISGKKELNVPQILFSVKAGKVECHLETGFLQLRSKSLDDFLYLILVSSHAK